MLDNNTINTVETETENPTPAQADTTNQQQEPVQTAQPTDPEARNHGRSSVRSGPSREIAEAFGTARTNIIASGSRRTRSVTGNLPAGSLNFQRSLRIQRPDRPDPPSTNEKAQEARPDSTANAIEIGQGRIHQDTDIRKICVQENTNITDQVNALASRLENTLERYGEVAGVHLDETHLLRDEIEALKSQLQFQERPSENQELAEDVRLLRSDLNRLLEERSIANSHIRGNDRQVKDEYAHQRPNVENEKQALLARLQELDNQQSESSQEAPALQQLPSRQAAENEDLKRELEYVKRERDELLSQRTERSRDLRALPSRRSSQRHRSHKREATSRRRTNASTSSSSNDDNEIIHVEDGETSDQDELDRRIAFFEREKGPRYPGITSIKPADPAFDKVMNYRYYRLKRVKNARSASNTVEVRRHLKALELTLKSEKFSGKDPILVLNFLARFVEEADTIRMTEAQAFIALPHFLTGQAENEFRSSRNSANSGGVSCWPEAVQYLLETYATSSSIRDAVNLLRDIRQQATENETQFATRLNKYAYRCANVFDEHQKITFFVNGLPPTIQSLVARYRESQPRHSITFNRLVLYARDEGDACRARGNSKTQTRRNAINNPLQYLGASSDTPNSTSHHAGEALLVPEESVDTADLPSTTITGHSPEHEQLLIAPRVHQPAPINYGGPRATPNRVGWVDRPVSNRTIVCYNCYEVGKHISPDCTLKFSDYEAIIKNYESLSADDKRRVPDTAYRAAKHLAELHSSSEEHDRPGEPKK